MAFWLHDRENYLRSSEAVILWNPITADACDPRKIVMLTAQERELKVRRHVFSTLKSRFRSFPMIQNLQQSGICNGTYCGEVTRRVLGVI